jgi:hypothetical protein
MDVCLLCFYVVLSCVGRGLCDGLITRPEESYRVCQLYVIKKPEWLRKNLSSEEKVLRKKIYCFKCFFAIYIFVSYNNLSSLSALLISCNLFFTRGGSPLSHSTFSVPWYFLVTSYQLLQSLLNLPLFLFHSGNFSWEWKGTTPCTLKFYISAELLLRSETNFLHLHIKLYLSI